MNTKTNINDVKLVMVDAEKHFDIMHEKFTETFSQTEPMTIAAEAKSEDVKEIYHYLVGLALKQPLSVLAYIGDKCVGGMLNYTITEIPKSTEDPNLTFNNDFTQKMDSKERIKIKARPIVVVTQEIEKNYSFFIPDCKKLFKIDVLFVDPIYVGNGIGTKLTQKAIDLARHEKCDYIMTVASAAGSGHIFKKLGFECVREIPFSSFHYNGQRMLKDFHDGNKTVKLMFLKIN